MKEEKRNRLISIIVPIFRVEKELPRCMESILNQTEKNIEIILVDDGSDDGCPDLCDSYVAQDMRVKVIHKQNRGLSDARNVGLLNATGKYVLYVDSDDYIDAETCSKFISFIDDDIDIVVGAYIEVNKDKRTIYRHSNLSENKVYSAKEFVINSIKANEWYAPAVLNLYNREFLLKNKLFYKEGLVFEDIEMLPRLFLAAKKVKYMDFPFYMYVIRQNSIMTSRVTGKKVQMSIEIYRDWFDLFAKISDNEYQRYLFGALIKYYLANCRHMKISGWEIQGLDFKFSFKYALNLKEKLKVLMFFLLPELYINI